uniref:Uncharacterized protein n=1 Tax=Kalanchoe fedtschenkoi TaxID=63787 RepID=A0A7N1A7Q2_KALFE
MTLANSTSFGVSGITSFTAPSAQKTSAHSARRGVLASSRTLTPFIDSVTLAHPKKLPRAMSRCPIPSPPKKAFPLLEFIKLLIFNYNLIKSSIHLSLIFNYNL